jgi:hypothetical protein
MPAVAAAPCAAPGGAAQSAVAPPCAARAQSAAASPCAAPAGTAQSTAAPPARAPPAGAPPGAGLPKRLPGGTSLGAWPPMTDLPTTASPTTASPARRWAELSAGSGGQRGVGIGQRIGLRPGRPEHPWPGQGVVPRRGARTAEGARLGQPTLVSILGDAQHPRLSVRVGRYLVPLLVRPGVCLPDGMIGHAVVAGQGVHLAGDGPRGSRVERVEGL